MIKISLTAEVFVHITLFEVMGHDRHEESPKIRG